VNTTPLWVPLVVAALGLAATLVGVMITQRRADKREAVAWEREQERERARWSREDAAQTFEHRRIAYVSFYHAVSEMGESIHRHHAAVQNENMPVDSHLPEGWQSAADDDLELLELYATPTVATLAREARQACWDWGYWDWGSAVERECESGDFRSRTRAWRLAMVNLKNAIRQDLGVPER
jgi:hypothetical protein